MQASIADLVARWTANYEFVYATGPHAGRRLQSASFPETDADSRRLALWIRDPPGGKGGSTTGSDWADASVAYLDNVLSTQGPFYGILGYSQGSAMAGYYTAIKPAGTFQVALLFCGYLPTTHPGLMATYDANSPVSTRALIWMGQQDYVIANALTTAQANKFPTRTVISSPQGSHAPPSSSDSSFEDTVGFLAGR